MPMTPEEAEISNARYAMVVKANDLIQKSRFSLTTQQQKIILFLISKITPEDEDFKRYQFSIIDFCNVCGIDYKNGQNYSDIKKAIKELRDKSIWVKLDDGRETLISWIEKAYIEERSGTIEVKLDADLKPWLIKLGGNYTQYELIYTLHFKSKYSIRLYELIKSIHYSYNQTYKRRYDLDELRRLLDAEKYKDYMNFKARALSVAVAEINKYSDKIVEYVPITKPHSKKIVAVDFYISSKPASDVIGIQAEIERDLDSKWSQTTLFDDKLDLIEADDNGR